MAQREMQRSVVITGAGSGIGAGIARRFAADGHRAVLFDRDGDAINSLRDELEARGLDATAVRGDVTSADDLERLADTLQGDIHSVIANAGVALGGVFDAIPLTEWERLYDVNVFGVVRTVNAFLARLRQQGHGRIVIMSSSAGLFPDDPYHAPYASSKAALIAIARSLSLQLARDDIEVSVVCPRLTNTPFPLEATAWTPSGPRTSPPPDLHGADTVDALVDLIAEGLAQDRFLISATPDTQRRLHDFADDPEAYLAILRRKVRND